MPPSHSLRILRLMLPRIVLCLAVVAGIAEAGVVNDNDTVVPLVYDGAGWSTEIVLANLGKTDASIHLAFVTPKGFAETWKAGLTATPMLAGTFLADDSVDTTIAPGGSITISTAGTAEKLTRGYARLILYSGGPVGATANIVKKVDGKMVQSFVLPLAPESERRSMLPLRLDAETGLGAELVFVSETSYTRLDLTFRDPKSTIVLQDNLTFDAVTQMYVPVADTWPQLKSFQGTVEWQVSWPTADIYANLYLASGAILSRRDALDKVVGAMTLPGDQSRARQR